MTIPSPSAATIDRRALIRDAFRLEHITLAWMTVEATVAIGSGATAGSLLRFPSDGSPPFGASSAAKMAMPVRFVRAG